MPISEAALWLQLRKGKLGYRFRRQVPIGPYIADFACLNPKVVIEVDGSSHEDIDERPRTAILAAHGFRLLRIDNEQVASETGRLGQWIQERMREFEEGE